MPNYIGFAKVKSKTKSKAGRKGTALGGFRTNLYKFGSQAGNVNAFLQRPFVQRARRNAYTAARSRFLIICKQLVISKENTEVLKVL